MGGVFSRSTRAASVSLVPAPSSPTHSGSRRSDSSGSLSPTPGSPESPKSPITLALPPAKSPPKYPGISADQDPLLPPNLSLLEEGGASINPTTKLSTCGLVRANVARRYEQFAMSKVGLVTRAFVMSLPQSIAFSSALAFSFSGLITPPVLQKGSVAQIQNYFLSLVIFSITLTSTAAFYDSFHRLKNHFFGGNYNSFGIFRLRATFMGAALGDSALRTILYDLAQSKNVWLNFSLTLPATIIPAYVRCTTFKHDIIPSPLNKNDIKATLPGSTQNKIGFLNSHFFNVASATCIATSSGLLFYRAVTSVLLKGDYRQLTTPKIFSALIPGVLGGGAKLLERYNPNISHHWKQFEVLAGDAAMIFMGIASSLPNPKNEMTSPDYWWGTVAYLVFTLSVMLSAVQASRVTPNFSR